MTHDERIERIALGRVYTGAELVEMDTPTIEGVLQAISDRHGYGNISNASVIAYRHLGRDTVVFYAFVDSAGWTGAWRPTVEDERIAVLENK